MQERDNEARKRESEEKRKRRLADEIRADFERRREERRSLENGWLLNMNFLSGNQYCDISPDGETEEEDKRFYWQSRRVQPHRAHGRFAHRQADEDAARSARARLLGRGGGPARGRGWPPPSSPACASG